jgi:hypothetical protein
MKTHKSTLPNGESLSISYASGFRNLSIKQDGEQLAAFANPDDFRNGLAIQTKAGEKVTLVIDHAGLAAWHNGTEILTGQKSGTIDYFTQAIWGTFGMAGIAFLIGISGLLASWNSLPDGKELAVLLAIAIPASMAGFAWWAKQSNQKLPLGLAMVSTVLGILGGVVPMLFGIALVIYQILGINKGSLFAPTEIADDSIIDQS